MSNAPKPVRVTIPAKSVSTLEACRQLLEDQQRNDKITTQEVIVTALNFYFEQNRP